MPPSTGLQGAVVAIDPATGVMDKPVAVASPGQIAASADGKYLYIIQGGGKTVGRLNLSAGLVDRIDANRLANRCHGNVGAVDPDACYLVVDENSQDGAADHAGWQGKCAPK